MVKFFEMKRPAATRESNPGHLNMSIFPTLGKTPSIWSEKTTQHGFRTDGESTPIGVYFSITCTVHIENCWG